MNNDENNVYLDLTNVHDGQYVTVDDNDGTIQIAQVQESSVDNSYNLNPVDIANITLDLSNNYDLLKTLVEEATKEKLDLSGLIIAWLKQYPDLSAELSKLNDANKLVATYKSQVDDLTDQNKELEKEINDLQAEKEKNQSSESKNGTQTGISKDDSQVQTDNNKTSEKPSDEVSDQNKNVGANNEQ